MATPTHSAAVTVDDPHAAHGGDGHGHGDLMLVGHDGQLHPANLQHHFVSAEQQFEASKLGMWLFLVTEILLFGALFVAYGIFRYMYPDLFDQASAQLDTVLGGVNTLVLLGSSLTMVWAIRGAQMDNQKVLFWNLIATIALAGTFMTVKYFEYTHKFELGIYPGYNFELEEDVETVGGLGGVTELTPQVARETGIAPAAEGEALPVADAPLAVEAHETGEAGEHAAAGHGREGEIFSNRRAGLFFSIYYVMTGIHAIHILIGMIAIGILAWKARRGRYSSVWYTPVENVGLYWHVVDIIWIFVFPLMYLI